MSRGDRWAAAAISLAFAGCMRIYPDPELPDIVVEWSADFECAKDTDRVVVSLSAVDPAAEVDMVTVPCRDASVRFDDVARVQYHLTAKLEDATGAVFGGHDEELDLHDGISERVFAFFGRLPEDNFRVAWTFDMGASCEALSATLVRLRTVRSDGGLVFFFDAPCDAPVFVHGIPQEGTFTLDAQAVAGTAVVASSPRSAPFTITRGEVTDLGTLTLTPCAAACPLPGL